MGFLLRSWTLSLLETAGSQIATLGSLSSDINLLPFQCVHLYCSLTTLPPSYLQIYILFTDSQPSCAFNTLVSNQYIT